MNKLLLIYVLIGLSLLSIGYSAYVHLTSPDRIKVGVVQMDELVYEYDGMKEATEAYTQQLESWKAQADSIEMRMRDVYAAIKRDSASNNTQQMEANIRKFEILQNSYGKTGSLAQQEDQRLTQGVLTQLYAHMDAFSAAYGYDLIITNTEANTIGFVDRAHDVTDELLAFANNNYQNED